MVQEALTNVRKHADARTASVRVSDTPAETTLVIEDDGRGFDPEAVDPDGFGLHAMRERTELVAPVLIRTRLAQLRHSAPPAADQEEPLLSHRETD